MPCAEVNLFDRILCDRLDCREVRTEVASDSRFLNICRVLYVSYRLFVIVVDDIRLVGLLAGKFNTLSKPAFVACFALLQFFINFGANMYGVFHIIHRTLISVLLMFM